MAVMTDTRDSWLRLATMQLAQAGVDSPAYDALMLLCHGMGVTHSDAKLHPETILTADDLATLSPLLARRVAREPLAHITGTRGFWTLDLTVTPDVLDPRPDTECLVEAVLARLSDRKAPLRLLDLGTGSGAIALALLAELPNATALGVDVSTAALQIAAQNAEQNDLADRFATHQGDWDTNGQTGFDIIVSNPPYIPERDIAGLAPEVRGHEPHLALTPGADGLAAYKVILARLDQWAKTDSLIGFECGFDQAPSLRQLMIDHDLKNTQIDKDLAGIGRAVTGRR